MLSIPISAPKNVYHLELAEGRYCAPSACETPQKRKIKGKKSNSYSLVVAAIVFIFAAGGLALYFKNQPDFKPLDEKRLAYKIPQGPSITVVAFKNLTPNKETNYLSQSIADNIVSVLSGSPDLLVMSAKAASNLRSETPEIREIAEATGVRYVLTGNYQVIGKQVRVTAQLSDALKGKALWSSKFDSSLDELFEILDEISNVVFEEAQVQVAGIGRGELSYFKSNEDYLSHRKCSSLFQQRNPESNKQAERCITELLEVDPENPVIRYMSGWITFQRAWMGWSETPEKDKAVSREIAQSILEDYPGPPYLLLGWIDLDNIG